MAGLSCHPFLRRRCRPLSSVAGLPACSKFSEKGTWRKGAGIGGQDQCMTMQLAIGAFIIFWIGYVMWMTWELKQVRDAKPQPTHGV